MTLTTSRDVPPADRRARLGPGGSIALVVFLIFVAFPVVQMFDDGVSTGHAAAVLVPVAAFVALYLWVMIATPSPAAVRASLIVLAAFATLVSLVDERPFSLLYIYVAAVAGFRLRGRSAAVIIAAAAAATGILAQVQTGEPDQALTFAIYAVGIGCLLIGSARLAISNAQLADAREELATLAVAQERLRFARDLHDLLGHSLSVVALKSQLGRRLIDADPQRAKTELEEIEQVTRAALEEVREAVGGYRQTTLADELGGARTALAAAGIDVDVARSARDLPGEVDAVLGWTVREGSTNVLRHSGARTCAIRVRHVGDAAEVEIADDGRGGPADPASSGRSGLVGLRERVAALGGRLEAGGRPEGGFRLRVTVPTE